LEIRRMRSGVFVAALALMLASLPVAAEPAVKPESRPEPNLEIDPEDAEPVKCFKIAWGPEADFGLGLPMGMAVDLCSGTRSSRDTLRCFRKAWGHPGNDGLGLPLGMAVRLCSTNPKRD
jgi:hypothetical protein